MPSLLSQQLFATPSHRWDFPQWNTLAITRQGLPILWDLHWKCSSFPRATGPPPLFHGYLDTHSPEWRHPAMNPGICDPATDRHSSATDSIKLQIKAGTSKGLWGGSMEAESCSHTVWELKRASRCFAPSCLMSVDSCLKEFTHKHPTVCFLMICKKTHTHTLYTEVFNLHFIIKAPASPHWKALHRKCYFSKICKNNQENVDQYSK